MKHPFPLKEIALQSGLSLATVDRALHGRAHVSAQTSRRVQAAIVELTRQEGQLAARGRRMFIDIVVEAPRRFSDELRWAANQVLPKFAQFLQRLPNKAVRALCSRRKMWRQFALRLTG